MMKKLMLIVMMAMLCVAATAQAKVVNVDLQASGGDTYVGLAAAADDPCNTTWNGFTVTAGSSSISDLTASDGSATTIDVALSGVEGVWNGDGNVGDSDLTHDQANVDTGPAASFTISGLDADTSYAIYLYTMYHSGTVGWGDTDYTIGAVTETASSASVAPAATDGTGWSEGNQYVKIIADSDGSGEITGSWNYHSDRYGCLAGIQIMPSADETHLESREISWDYDSANWTDGVTQTYAGRIADGNYIDGMWSAATLNYERDANELDINTLSDSTNTYIASGYVGPSFSNGGYWAAPTMGKTYSSIYSNKMGGTKWGGAEVFTNVFGSTIDLTISGSYVTTVWNNYWYDSWIIKKGADGYTVLFEDHRQQAGSQTITLATPIEVTLLPGEQIFVAFGIRVVDGARQYQLRTAGLTWDVVPVDDGIVALEPRVTSWDYDEANWVEGVTKDYVGRVADGNYIDGMWSAATMNYTLDDVNATGSPTDFNDLTVAVAVYDANKFDGDGEDNGFSRTSDYWGTPTMFRDMTVHYSNKMGGNNWGAAEVFTNVFGGETDVTIWGSYRTLTWGGNWHDSWILKRDLWGNTTVLFEYHQADQDYSKTITLTTPIEVTLKAGEQIFVMMGGRGDAAGARLYKLYTDDLNWIVKPSPNPNQFAMTDTPPVIDGAYDPNWADAKIYYNYYLSSKSSGVDPYDSPDEVRMRCRGMWDDDNLYVLVEVVDDLLMRDGPIAWLDDSIELYTDVLEQDKAYELFEPYIHQTTLGIEFTGNPVTPAQSGSNPVSGTYRMVVNGSQGSSGSYVLEASIPWSNLGGTYTPSIGDQIGFGIGINDADQAGNTRDYQVMWSTNLDFLHANSKYFPAVILVEDAPAATDCAEAVEMCPFLPSILSANFSDDDCIVNLRDFAVLADDWLGSWDIVDLADIAEQWLDCIDVTGNDASCVW